MLSSKLVELSDWTGRSRPERLQFGGNQFVGQMDRPSTSLDSIRREMVKTTSACVITRLSHGKSLSITNSPNKTTGRFVMNYIGIDVSKQVLSVFNGKKESRFKNERWLKGLKSYLEKKFKSFDQVVIIFESTGSYSNYLKEFCWVNRIKACIVNPKKSANFAKVIGNRSKTDRIDAITLYKFKTVIRPEDILIPRVDKVSEELSAYVSSYEFALKRANALSNHIEALRYNPNAPKDLLICLKRN